MPERENAKRLERRLIRELRRNSSLSISKIARKIKTPITTVYEAEKKLRLKGIITRYYSSIDYEKVGFPIRALFLMNVDEDRLQETAENLMKHPNVNNLQLLDGSCNLLAEAIFGRIEHFLNFNEQLTQAGKKEVFYVLEELKTEAADLGTETFRKS